MISSIYRAAVRLRHFLYDQKILSQKASPLPVISIGNVMAGGVGKTQVTLLLAEELSKDLHVAVLSRGYRGLAEHRKEPLVVDASKHSARFCGDEPWLLASRLGATRVIVNKNRFQSVVKAKQLGAQIVLLDDGMQHRRLHRDFEIVVIDGQTPFGHFLPKGRLREDLCRLKSSDLIFFVGEPQSEILKQVSALTSAPQVVTQIVITGLFDLGGESLPSILGKRVALFCGIGNPKRFVKTVEALGAQVVATHFCSDHRMLGKKALQKFALFARAQGATLLLCSEKDKVKLSANDIAALPIGWLRANLEIIKNHSAWAEAVQKMRTLGRL